MSYKSLRTLVVMIFSSLITDLSVADSVTNSATCEDYNPHRTAFFGDTHIHSRYSLDASTQDTRTTPEQAYEFARGKKLGIQPWNSKGEAQRFLQLSRPLDFAMVSDHAELLGEVSICNNPESELYSSWQCVMLRDFPRGGYFLFNLVGMSEGKRLGFCGESGEFCRQAAIGPWKKIQAAAESAYDRCQFTSFIGYEWTGAPDSQNIHRNVIFKNNQVPELPVSYIDGPSAEQLFQSLEKECREGKKGCDALAIPHNSNLSNGLMFPTLKKDGTPITAEEAKLRASYEKLVEVMQHKGSSECYFNQAAPLNNADELCGFEQLPYNQFSGRTFSFMKEAPKPSGGFIRQVLREGLQQEKKLGENPFKFGMIASTDTHLGAPGEVDEKNFKGHGGAGSPNKDKVKPGLPDALEYNPGGLAVLWAEENTRESLFSAMKRREAYGTSGPRISLRFFGGYEYPDNLCQSHDFVKEGYAKGVPMGGDLSGGDKPLTFSISTLKDAGTQANPGTSLQRVQVIKGWIDEKGESREKVFDVAGNPDNGATVDLATCERKGEGFASLCTVWKDPEFDPGQSAFYYTRVVENPSCRWSQYICNANKVDCSKPETIGEGLEGCCSPEHQPVIQERAWSSPIWYIPS
ncbi:DUF3604 domain-containing protein [Endozoicomonas arenosclerae]|uniref:DUF3604 domain-containing protein n=1 Tax=Endozoicomonas arenosclerae TaxID=1633495 RepID=UPI000780E680|nr:DUF3604 domain-containing protein [Endozoicomonas arenosclerae]